MKKTLLVTVMTLIIGAMAYGAGPDFKDANGDGVCDGYVSRGNKTVSEAGNARNGQYKMGDSRRATTGNIEGNHMMRKEAPGKGKNRK